MDMVSKKYKIGDRIGKGSYGYVYKGRCLYTGREVALKMMENAINTEYDTAKALREVQILKKTNEFCEINGAEPGLFVPELIDLICSDS